jgi:hypothetical protein
MGHYVASFDRAPAAEGMGTMMIVGAVLPYSLYESLGRIAHEISELTRAVRDLESRTKRLDD